MLEISSLIPPLLLAATTASLYGHEIKTPSPTSATETTSSLIHKVWNVVKCVFKAAVSVFHYFLNPTIFTCTFFGTIIWAKEAEEIAARVDNAWHSQPWAFSCLSVAAAAFSLPVALATGTIFWACRLGLAMAYRTPVDNAIMQTL